MAFVLVLFTDIRCSITKLMGESFKLHSQALAGYEDALNSAEQQRQQQQQQQQQTQQQQNGAAADATLAPHATEVAAF